MLSHVTATRYVQPLTSGGSVPGLVEADDLGTYVVKFTGSAQGRKALVAEIVVGELARRLGFRVPELVLVDFDPAVARDEPHQEVQDLVRASAGINLGMDLLPGAVDFHPGDLAVDPAEAGRVVWLDALTANVDRTVHLSDKAVEPPGEARSDLEIFCDYARRMDLRDRDGAPLITWNDPESAFEAWKECSRGRPCDYTGLSYEKLRGGSGVPWPCNDEYPNGRDRLYADAVFPTHADVCESYGRDLLTGGITSREEYHARNPDGRAVLRAAEYVPPPEEPDGEYPLVCTTGRTVYHFHTRTKTGRSRQLRRAAPKPWIEMSRNDAAALGLTEGDPVRVESRRGRVELPVRVGGGRDGVVFLPFHYGYWDSDTDDRARAANELTLTAWDPVSKQPLYKLGAVRVTKLADGKGPAPAPTTAASAPHDPAGVPATTGDDDVWEDVAATRPPPAPPSPDVPHHS